MEEIKTAIDNLGKTFEQFKSANDERLKEIEKRGSSDAVLTEKVEKLNAAVGEMSQLKERLDLIELRSNRPGGGSQENPDKAQHKEAFYRFVRKGDDAGLHELERKAVNITTPGDGGYGVPDGLDREIEKVEMDNSAMRQIARVIQVSNEEYRKLVNLRGTASGWVGEATARTETNAPTWAEVAAVCGEIYANPAVTQRSLDDIFFDVEAELAQGIGDEFADEEGDAFINGNGTNKPKGILQYTMSSSGDSTRTFGQLQYIASGAVASLGETPFDVLIDLMQAVKKKYRNRGVFLLNGLTLAELRKVKNGNGDYIWQPSVQAGQPDTLLAKPIAEDDNMPDMDTNAYPVAFGDFSRGYYILDIRGIRMLRDPFTNKPYVHFYTTKRVGGMVVNSEAIKVIKCAAA